MKRFILVLAIVLAAALSSCNSELNSGNRDLVDNDGAGACIVYNDEDYRYLAGAKIDETRAGDETLISWRGDKKGDNLSVYDEYYADAKTAPLYIRKVNPKNKTDEAPIYFSPSFIWSVAEFSIDGTDLTVVFGDALTYCGYHPKSYEEKGTFTLRLKENDCIILPMKVFMENGKWYAIDSDEFNVYIISDSFAETLQSSGLAGE